MLSTIPSEHGSTFACLSVQRRLRFKRQEREGLSDQEGVILRYTSAGHFLTVRSSSSSCGRLCSHVVEGSEN
jgi:hypothetical protein